MARFYGKVGYSVTSETAQGVWTETITERNYYGEVRKITRKLESSGNVNDDINISNEISIVADAFALNNFHSIKYVEWMGTKWKVPTVTVERPRLLLAIGGVYNG